MGKFKFFLAFIGSILMFAGQTPRQDAISNISSYIPFDDIPTWLTSPNIDTWATIIGFILIVITITSFFLNKRDRNPTKKEPVIKKSITEQSETEKYKPAYEQDFDEFAQHKDVGTTPELKPDAYISDAIDHIKNILFPDRDPQHLDYQFEIPAAVNKITEKLRTGELKSWALYTGESVPRVLNSEIWEFRELIPESASRESEKKDPQTRSVINDANQHQLTGLRVNMSQVKSLWRLAGKEINSDKHNVSLLEAVHYVASGKWGNVRKLLSSCDALVSDDDIEKITKAWRDLEQSAIDGDIRIWGEDSKGHWILIPDNTYWQRHWICWTNIMTADEENDWDLNSIIGVDSNDKSRHDDLYHRYKTSKQDIEKLWP